MARSRGSVPVNVKVNTPRGIESSVTARHRIILSSYFALRIRIFQPSFFFFFLTIRARLTGLSESLRLVIEVDSAKHHLHSTSALTLLSQKNRFI